MIRVLVFFLLLRPSWYQYKGAIRSCTLVRIGNHSAFVLCPCDALLYER